MVSAERFAALSGAYSGLKRDLQAARRRGEQAEARAEAAERRSKAEAAEARRARDGLRAARSAQREAEDSLRDALERAERAEEALRDAREQARESHRLGREGLSKALEEAADARKGEATMRRLLEQAEGAAGPGTPEAAGTPIASQAAEAAALARATAAEQEADGARMAAAEAETALTRLRRVAAADREARAAAEARETALQRQLREALERCRQAQDSPRAGIGLTGAETGSADRVSRLRRDKAEALMALAAVRDEGRVLQREADEARRACSAMREECVERRVVGRLLVEWCARPEKRADVSALMAGMLALTPRERELLSAASGGDAMVPRAAQAADEQAAARGTGSDAVASLAHALGSFISGEAAPEAAAPRRAAAVVKTDKPMARETRPRGIRLAE